MSELGLLHTRLAIIDLVTGEQPIWNETRTIACVFNGEIYNFRALRAELAKRGHTLTTTTDTEVLVHLYEDLGEDMLERLHGMFALALWDSTRRRLLVARDRLGIKPLYLAQGARELAFASSIPSLVALESVSRDLDPVGLAQYLQKYKFPEPRTAFRGVRALPPGHCCTWDAASGVIRSWKFASLPPAGARRGDEPSARAAFERAIESHLVADVEVGAFLSGGIDSTLVVAQAQRLASRPLRTFSIAFRGQDAFDESYHAERVAQALGTRHETFDAPAAPIEMLRLALRAAGQPFAVASFLPLLLLSERAAREVKVVLTGDGGDEVGGGYPWYRWMRWTHGTWPKLERLGVTARPLERMERTFGRLPRLRPLRRAAKFARGAVSSPTAASDAWRYDLGLEQAAALLNRDLMRVGNDPAESDWPPIADPVEGLRRFDIAVLLRDEMLPKVDRAGMAFGLEGRVPLLDDEFVDAMLAIPMAEHMVHAEGKALLRSWAKELCPTVDALRPKHGFDVPIASWLDGALRDEVRHYLLNPGPRRLFDHRRTTKLLARMRAGVPGAGHTAYAMLLAELWHDVMS